MRTVVLSLGGSLIVPDAIDIDFLKGFKKLINDFIVDNRVIIVCGGGKVCRNYQNALGELSDVDNDAKDWVGIAASRLNAELVKQMFGSEAYEKTIIDPTQRIETDKKIIVAAGWKPGFSTDMDAVELAKQFDASEVLNISNADHVYNKDPNKFDDAKPYDKLSWKEFFEIVGLNAPFDPIASKEAERTNIVVKILGKDINNLNSCIQGNKFDGTTIE